MNITRSLTAAYDRALAPYDLLLRIAAPECMPRARARDDLEHGTV
jgi:hypothetical protein